MRENEVEYFSRRAGEARAQAAAASLGIVRETHEKFATAYAERVAQELLTTARISLA